MNGVLTWEDDSNVTVDEECEDCEVEDHGRARTHILLGHVSKRQKALPVTASTRLK